MTDDDEIVEAMARALYRAGSALGMFVMLIGEHHPGVGARIDALLDDAAIREALLASNEAADSLRAYRERMGL